MTDEPAWQQLHDAWWDERCQPQPGDLAAAWAALWPVVPAGWTVGRPQHNRVLGQWNVSAVLVTGVASRIGHMPKVVSAQGPTEPTVLVELARCLVVYAGGGVPR